MDRFASGQGHTVPIEKLANATKEVSKGNLDVQVEDPASDEIGIFIESFNQMISGSQGQPASHCPENLRTGSQKAVYRDHPSNITTGSSPWTPITGSPPSILRHETCWVLIKRPGGKQLPGGPQQPRIQRSFSRSKRGCRTNTRSPTKRSRSAWTIRQSRWH